MLRGDRLRRIIRFGISGGSAALVEYFMFIFLHYVNVELIIANTFSFMSGFIVSFLLNKTWVFSNRNSVKNQLLKYAILAIINLLISNVALGILVSDAHVPSLIAKVITMTAIASWNYIVFSKFVFNTK